VVDSAEAEVFAEADSVVVDFEVVDLAEEDLAADIEVAVHAVEVREGGHHLVGQEPGGPYQVGAGVHIRIIVTIPGADIIDIGTCHGIEDGGILPIGRDIIVVLGIILQRIWAAV